MESGAKAADGRPTRIYSPDPAVAAGSLERLGRLATGLGTRAAKAIALPIAVIALWQLIVELGLIPRVTLPGPDEVFGRAAVSVFVESSHVYFAILASLRRIFTGWVIAVVIGISVGLLASLSQSARLMLEWPINACRSLPPAAIVPLAILWIGIGDWASISLVAFIAVWPVLINTVTGIETVPSVQREAALTMGATTRQLVLTVLIPSALPSIFVGLRLAMGLAWMGVVLSELVGVKHGIGALLLSMQTNGDVAAMLLLVMAIGVLGVLLDWAFRAAVHPLTRWQRGVVLE